MARVAVYTSFTFGYLPRALVLVKTLRLVHPDWDFWALLVERPTTDPAILAALGAFDHVLYAHELGVERHEAWLFKHDIVEACTAVKGQMMVHLLRLGAEKVVYLDPDIAVFHPLDSIVDRLDGYSIILTPHQTEPNPTWQLARDNEMTSMQYGIYNLGFVAVRNDAVGRSFADWWARQLYHACYDDVARGIFTDQKYCDLVPGLFDRVFIERDPGCNVASWNLTTRKMSFDAAGTVLVNGAALKFYHFTKINGVGDVMTEKLAGDNTEVMEVWNWYKREIAEQAAGVIGRVAWSYGQFANGAVIHKKMRVVFRSREDLMAFFDDPFDPDGDASFYNWLSREAPELIGDDAAS